MAACIGASITDRTFTATSSHGLLARDDKLDSREVVVIARDYALGYGGILARSIGGQAPA